jgi:hypothetical protein
MPNAPIECGGAILGASRPVFQASAGVFYAGRAGIQAMRSTGGSVINMPGLQGAVIDRSPPPAIGGRRGCARPVAVEPRTGSVASCST